MGRMLIAVNILCLVLLLSSGSVLANEGDVAGSEDHPLLSRFAGSTIVYHEVRQFDEYRLPLGPSIREGTPGDWQVNLETKDLEGRVTRIQYDAPEDRSTLEIQRSYENALQRAGFEILFSAGREELGPDFGEEAYDSDEFAGGVTNVSRDNLHYYLRSTERHQRYVAARLSRSEEGDAYAAIFASVSIHKPTVAIQVDIIEVMPMEEGLVSVGTMLDDMDRTGRTVMRGLYFELDKADIQPASEPTLAEVARLLEEKPKLDLYVVGHTDTLGALDYNVDLSRKRAEAVVAALLSDYGIDGSRLEPIGIGPVAPVASNETDEGRAMNRRVELVGR